MMAAKPGRNDVCPCGSGKKYKKCCLAADQAKIESTSAPTPVPRTRATPAMATQWVYEDDDLDEMSNSVVDLINAGRLNEAEARCQELKQKYPMLIDWRERFAAVYEAKGELQKALDHYRLAKEFAETNEGFDTEGIDYYQRKITALERALPAG